MRALHVFPVYPGAPGEGSAVYARQLTRALRRAGVHVDVLATRTERLRYRGAFDLGWPRQLARREAVDDISVRRFAAAGAPAWLRRAADRAVLGAWRRENERDGEVVPGSAQYLPGLVSRARARRAWIDALADLGRGPLAPGLLARVARMCTHYDVVLVGHAPFAIMGQVQAVAARRGRPVLLLPFLHETDPFHHFSRLYRAYERAAAVLVLSEHTRDVIAEHLPRARPVAIGAGADAEHFSARRASPAAFRARQGLEGRRILLFVGRKEPSKRYEVAIEALEGLPDDVVLVMVGRDVDGRPLPPDRVRHLGAISDQDLVDAYATCEALLVPSEHESFGMVCLEAWLLSKPVIANARCGSLAALVDPGVDGLLCTTPGEWGAAARRLLDDPTAARGMGESGRGKVLARYTWERVAERALEEYARAVSVQPASERAG